LAEESDAMALPAAEREVIVGDGYRTLVERGGYTNPDRKIASLRWVKRSTLYDGVDKVFIKTEIDWDGEDTHLYADFPLRFDHGTGAWYEIPYGMLYREDAIEVHKHLGYEDEWVALNYFATYDAADDVSVVLYNKGTPGCRVKGDVMQLSLLRSPTVLEYANEGARDHGHHVLEYALAITDGKPDATDPAAFGLRYVTPTPSVAASAKEGSAAPALLPLSTDGTTVQLTAIKRDERGELIVRLYESCGRDATVTLPQGVLASPTDLLEDVISDERTSTLTFKPFEIKTVRLH
jgi:alpha-mannosidase